MITQIVYFDESLLFFIQSNFHAIVLDKIMIATTLIGNLAIIWLVAAVILLAFKNSRSVGIMVIMAVIFSFIMGEGILKHIIQRPRPYDIFPAVQLLVAKSTAYSFPSGHTTTAFAAVYVMSGYLKRYAWLLWGLAGLMAFSRLYLFMHYPTDIIAGILLGLIVGKMVKWLYETVISKNLLKN